MKPRSLFPARDHRAAPAFHRAMLEVAAEDLAASPCVICAASAVFVGVWSPSARCIKDDLGGDPERIRRIFYKLCQRCADRGDRDRGFTATLENAVLEVWRAGNVQRFKDGVFVP
jgi:hypothetical protein